MDVLLIWACQHSEFGKLFTAHSYAGQSYQGVAMPSGARPWLLPHHPFGL